MKKIIKVALGMLVMIGALGVYHLTQPKTVHVQASYSKILSDEQAMDEADYIVVGKVKKNLDSYTSNGFPFTDSLVMVEDSIKGDIDDNFVFMQDGGYDKERNVTIIFDEYEVLKPGSTYVFFLDKSPEYKEKYMSVSGQHSVYEIDGKNLKNSDKSRNKALSELESLFGRKLKNID